MIPITSDMCITHKNIIAFSNLTIFYVYIFELDYSYWLKLLIQSSYSGLYETSLTFLILLYKTFTFAKYTHYPMLFVVALANFIYLLRDS